MNRVKYAWDESGFYMYKFPEVLGSPVKRVDIYMRGTAQRSQYNG